MATPVTAPTSERTATTDGDAPPSSLRSLPQAIELVLAENRSVLEKIDHYCVDQLAEAIVASRRIFVAGEGRSGLAIRMVAMRLMHLERPVFVLGETTTPALRKGDLFIVFSGSGKTGIVAMLAATAKSVGATVVAITTEPESPVGRAADLVVRIEAAAKQDRGDRRSKQFAGSLFEQAALLLFDAMFHVLSRRLGKDPDSLWRMHTNVE
jgi:6-phospho-3-hexuloisomerase